MKYLRNTRKKMHQTGFFKLDNHFYRRMAQTPGGTTTTETTRQVRGTARAKWGKPGAKGWFPDSDSDRSSQ